jgi:hypothetical protein
VFLAHDRHLSRQVVLRVVEPGDPTAAAALRDEGRMMSSVQFDSLQAIPVLVDGEIAGGGAYVASELVEGTPLDEVVKRRGPLSVRQARRHALELLDAGLAVRRRDTGRGDVVVASALVTTDGHIRVTRFARAAGPGPAGADPAVAAVASTLAGMLEGGQVPGALQSTIDSALSGRITSADALRERLAADTGEDDGIMAPPSGWAPPVTRWPWIVVAVIVLLVVVIAALLVMAGG